MCPTGVGNDTVKLHKNQERFEVAERGECGCVERGEGVGIQTQGLFVGRRMLGGAGGCFQILQCRKI